MRALEAKVSGRVVRVAEKGGWAGLAASAEALVKGLLDVEVENPLEKGFEEVENGFEGVELAAEGLTPKRLSPRSGWDFFSSCGAADASSFLDSFDVSEAGTFATLTLRIPLTLPSFLRHAFRLQLRM